MNHIVIIPSNLKEVIFRNVLLRVISIIILSIVLCFLNSCGNSSGSFSAPVAPSVSIGSSNYKSLNRNSVSDAQRSIVKTGNLRIKADNIRSTGELVENIVITQGGFMTSMNERDDSTKNAKYKIHVPAENLISTMDSIAALGKVDYRLISVKDVTQDIISQTARLRKLKARRARYQQMYSSASKISDKLRIEETLADIEEEIFTMEQSMSEMQRTARFSTLSLSIKRSKIRGPIGLISDASSWSLSKLFTIRE